jgi:hypothetical protein
MRQGAKGNEMLTNNQHAEMAEPLPLATMQLYRRLADGLSDMVEGGRLTAADCPDDYAWLTNQLAAIAAADPGDAVLPPHMRGSDEDLREAAEGEECDGCGRASIDCSRDPCPDVIADREGY